MMSKALHISKYWFTSADQSVPVVIRKHKTARHMIVRYQPLDRCLTLTLPRYVAIGQGLRFIEEKRGWIMQQLASHADAGAAFADGGTLPLLGARYRIAHTGGRGVVRIEGDCVLVPGEPEFLARRLQDWLRALARDEITPQAQAQAAQVEKRIRKITVRDTSSLWGSCTQDGNLSFSWRLVLAPREVLGYVVSHEVAHLVEMNHSKAFWQVVAQLCPHWRESRHWLQTHGKTLHAYR